MIFFTGDIHGLRGMDRLAGVIDRLDGEPNGPHTLVILGDFGIIWHPEETAEEKAILDHADASGHTVAFIDGNHENFDRLHALPEALRFNAPVGLVRDRVMWLKRGYVYDIHGASFFTMGGAKSIDRAFRTVGVNWWADEVATAEEIDRAWANLRERNFSVDYVLTHTCPDSVKRRMLPRVLEHHEPMELLLDEFHDRLTFTHWYFAHFHHDIRIDDDFTCLFEEVVPCCEPDRKLT